MMQQALRRSSFTLILALVMAVAAVLAAASPLAAQTSSAWMNTKISDLRAAQQKIPSEAAEHYETAQRYLVTIQDLSDKKDLSKRQQKKLDRAFRKAISELGAAIESSPDWVEARMALGSVDYKKKDYEGARDQYQEVLRIEPDNDRAKSYLETVQYYISHQDAADQESDDQSARAPWEEEGSGGR